MNVLEVLMRWYSKIPQRWEKVASSFFQHKAALRGVGRLLLLLHLNISISRWQSLASPSVPAVETNQVEIPVSPLVFCRVPFHAHAWMHMALLTKRSFLAGLTAAFSASGCRVENGSVTGRSRLKRIVSQLEVWWDLFRVTQQDEFDESEQKREKATKIAFVKGRFAQLVGMHQYCQFGSISGWLKCRNVVISSWRFKSQVFQAVSGRKR